QGTPVANASAVGSPQGRGSAAEGGCAGSGSEQAGARAGAGADGAPLRPPCSTRGLSLSTPGGRSRRTSSLQRGGSPPHPLSGGAAPTTTPTPRRVSKRMRGASRSPGVGV
ncbi:unnamed protein product, partial [Discosporangium mesarthrocarpum]